MEEKRKKRMNRTQTAIFAIFFPVGVMAVLGLPFAAIISKGDFVKSWIYTSAALYLMFGGGCSLGGILNLLIRTVDEDFLEKAGYGLWYGTFAGGYVLGRIFDKGLTADTMAVSFGICALICALIWARKRQKGN